MKVEILERDAFATCELTGKAGVEVWSIRAGGGPIQKISTQRLVEVLRVLTRAGEQQPAKAAPESERSEATKKG